MGVTDEQFKRSADAIATRAPPPATAVDAIRRRALERRQRFQVTAVAGATLAAVGVVAVGVAVFGPVAPDEPLQAADRAPSTVNSTAAPGAKPRSTSAAPSVSGVTPTQLAEVGVKLAQPTAEPALTAEEAIAAAVRAAGGHVDGQPVAELRQVTTENLGRATASGGVEPAYTDHLTWIVTLPATRHLILGQTGAEPQHATSLPVALVDANDGHIMISYLL